MSGDFQGFDTRVGVEDPDQLVAVPAGELDEWAWLADRPRAWLSNAADTTAYDLRRFFPIGPSREQVLTTLDYTRHRIGRLLDGDRGQP
ncbi:MAG: hypothetical protein ABR608_11735 [Pseudonocardiaceae bacterium]|jgi:hypothetical protein